MDCPLTSLELSGRSVSGSSVVADLTRSPSPTAAAWPFWPEEEEDRAAEPPLFFLPSSAAAAAADTSRVLDRLRSVRGSAEVPWW